MSDVGYETVIFGSGDASANPSRAGFFRVTFAIPLCEEPGEYEVSVVSASFPKPAVPDRSVFIQASFCENQVVGSQLLPNLFRTRPITASDPAVVHIEQLSPLIPWKQMRQGPFQTVDVQIVDSTGVEIPNSGFSLIECVVRRVK